MATKSQRPSTAAAKKSSLKPGQSPISPTLGDPKKKSLKPGEAVAPLPDPNAKKTSLKPGDGIATNPNAPPHVPTPSPPPVFRPWLRKIRPPWELPPKQPRPQPRWRIPNPKMLGKFKLPAQVEFQDAHWTRTMLDITMKKKYPKAVKAYLGPVEVTHELHNGPVQVYLESLINKMATSGKDKDKEANSLKVRVWGVRVSICTSRVLTALMEKNVDYDLTTVDIVKTQDHKKPEFLKLQPFGVIPVLQDKDLTLFESRAIIRYIARKYEGKGTPLYGTTEKDKCMVEQWLEVEAQNYNPLIGPIVYNLVFAAWFGKVGDPAVAEANLIKLEEVLDVYQLHLSKPGQKYLAGDFFSLADLSHLPFTHYLINHAGKGEIFAKRPAVQAWWNDISKRPAWVKHLSNAFPKT